MGEGADRLGRYVVLRRLASGGMADVLLARADGIEGFERHVVLKRIRAEHAKDPRFAAMFLDEARLAANLHHQHVVQVFDIGEADGEYFFAMEYLHGEDLRRMLSRVARQRGHVPLPHACAIVSAVAAGLHYAHERRGADKKPLGIVHRDVSPSNIFVGYDGSIKVVDFGIAKAASHGRDSKSAAFEGKAPYMSPEQCRGEPLDRRSDVWALGVVLYELATTTRLFKGENDTAVVDAIVAGKIPLPRIRRPELPNELSTIIMTALAVDPARRYQTAEDLKLALDAYAAKAGYAGGTADLASYMKKLFGERPEPWLEPATAARRDGESTKSWTEAPSGRSSRSITRTSSRFGFEHVRTPTPSTAPPMRPARRGGMKLVVGGIAIAVALGAVATWKLVSGSDAAPTAAAQPRAVEPTLRSPTLDPTPAPAPSPAGAPAAQDPAAATEPTKPAHAAAHAAPAPAPAAPPTTISTSDPIADPAPAPAPAPVPAPAPAPDPAPSAAAPVVASLSTATVDMVAADHAAELAKCESNADLHGSLSVRFEIDGAGKVTKSQMSSSFKNPKVAGCILRTFQTWQFPHPPTGAAKGTYTRAFD